MSAEDDEEVHNGINRNGQTVGKVHFKRPPTPAWGRGYDKVRYSSAEEECFAAMDNLWYARAELLLSDLEDVNYQEEPAPGFTLLHQACYITRYDFAEELLKRGAVIKKDMLRRSPMHLLASKSVDVEFFKLIIAYTPHDYETIDEIIKMNEWYVTCGMHIQIRDKHRKQIKELKQLLQEYKSNPEYTKIKCLNELGIRAFNARVFVFVKLIHEGIFAIKQD